MKNFEERLRTDKADKNTKWFEYGRSQALSSLLGDKLIVPMMASKTYAVYQAGEKDIPFAGNFIKAKDGNKGTLKRAKGILESENFYRYIQEHGTPTTKDSVRISVRDILEYRIPNVDKEELDEQDDEY